MEKKRRFLLLLAVLMLLTLVGCSEEKKTELDPINPTTVTLWHYYVGENQQALERAITEFNQTVGIEKGIIVDAVAKGVIAELEEAVTKSAQGIINAEPMPDIFSSYPDKAMEIDELGMVVDLNEYFTTDEQALYIEDFLADGIFGEGRLLMLPIVKSTELLYVNATAWEEFAKEYQLDHEALSTWENIIETGRQYYEWSGGKGLLGIDSVANYVIIGCKQQGVDVIDGQNQQAVLDEAIMRKLFDMYYGAYSLGYFDAIGKFRSDDIKASSLISYVGSSSSAAYFPTWIEKDNTQQPIEFLALPFPVFEGGASYAIQQGAGMCIAKTTPAKQEGAAVFLKWFTESGQNIQFSMTTGYLPVQQAAYTSPDFPSVLDNLRAGDEAQNNVASVYEIALYQITESHTYAAKPFVGSYNVRSVLQSSLLEMGEIGRAYAVEMRKNDLSDEEILAELMDDQQFDLWMQSITSELNRLDIAYVIQ